MEKIEKRVMELIAVLSIVISIFHFLGALENTWLADRISALTLLVVGSMAGYLVLEKRNKLDKIEQDILEGVSRTIDSLNGVEIRSFKDHKEVYEYMVRRMEQAQKSVDDLTWGYEISHMTLSQEEAFKNYFEIIPRICKRKNMSYRKVMTFHSLEQLESEEIIISQTEDFGYHLRYYNNIGHSQTIPLLNFIIIDSEEVVMGFYRHPYLPIEDEYYLSIRHPKIVHLFRDYYNTVWQGAKIIKEKDLIEKDELQDIRHSFKSRM